MKKSLIYIGATFSWDWTENWQVYVDLAKRFRCRWESQSKLWRVPTLQASVEITRACLALVPETGLFVRDFDSGKTVPASAYIAHDYLRRRSGLGSPKMAFQLVLEGTDVFLSLPLDESGRSLPEHALFHGLATIACAGVWHEKKGYLLKVNVREAVEFVVANGSCPVVGMPSLYEAPFVTELYDNIMPHQYAGISFLYNRKRAILADDMGLGKTMQAIIAAEQVKMDSKGKALLIVCPVTLISNWRRELIMWGCEYESVTIVPYSRLGDLGAVMKAYPKGAGLVVIVDEAHYLKNPASMRTKDFMYFTGQMSQLERLWFLTGTPVTKDFSNLWPMALMMQHPLAEKYRPSEMDNANSQKVQMIRGAISTHMMCRKKSDILTLPPKIQRVKQVDTGEDFDQLFNWEFMASGLSDAEFFKHLMRLKRMTAMVKTEHTLEMARKVLAEGRKVVIFSDHTKVLDELEEFLRLQETVVRICGKTKPADRGPLVEQFQKDPDCRVFLGHIKAAGVGLTLTAASDVIFNDFDWLPANMQQAEDRCYRIGQAGTVMVYYMADCNLILDDVICQKLADRSSKIATFEMSKQSVMTGVKKWLKEKVAAMKVAHVQKA